MPAANGATPIGAPSPLTGGESGDDNVDMEEEDEGEGEEEVGDEEEGEEEEEEDDDDELDAVDVIQRERRDQVFQNILKGQRRLD